VVPPLGSVVIAMMKNSAIVGAFGVGGDLFSVGSRLTSAQGFAALPVLTGVLLGYLAITLPTAAVLSRIEEKVAIDMELFEWDKIYINPLYGKCVPDRDFPKLLRHYQRGELKLDELVASLEEGAG